MRVAEYKIWELKSFFSGGLDDTCVFLSHGEGLAEGLRTFDWMNDDEEEEEEARSRYDSVIFDGHFHIIGMPRSL